jgi:hypothetical protein
LKDWLLNDAASAGRVADIENFISQSPDMSLCADLCNGSKHLALTRPRSSADTKIVRRAFHVAITDQAIGSGADVPSTFAAKYEVEAGGKTGKTYDAFEIAEACMREWEGHLQAKGLL